jgi:hypothetical protein
MDLRYIRSEGLNGIGSNFRAFVNTVTFLQVSKSQGSSCSSELC